MLHTFVAYVEDLPGVLTRVASLFRRLNINIISLTVGRSEREGLSRLTMVCDASSEAGHRIRASLFKLENVVDVDDIAQAPFGHARTGADQSRRDPPHPLGRSSNWLKSFARASSIWRLESLMIEMTGVESKIEGLIEVLNEGEGRDPRNMPQRQNDHAPRPSHQQRAAGHGRQERSGRDRRPGARSGRGRGRRAGVKRPCGHPEPRSFDSLRSLRMTRYM